MARYRGRLQFAMVALHLLQPNRTPRYGDEAMQR